ncbi:MAG: hypothetical protein GTO29_13375 [Candidatus Latescibacteria bacterium]|nr:hypothetical protein [Candidatus Latescibacterota bacterium]NIO57242.1 hypothetical protein [Candidatus Latescibacterota bacterium]
MSSAFCFTSRIQSKVLVTLAAAVLGLLPALFVGCIDSDELSGVTPAETGFAAVAATPPSIAEIQSAVNLTPGQVEAVEEALVRWRQAAGTQATTRARRGGRRLGEGQGFGLGTGEGYGMKHGMRGGGLLIDFLADVMPVLRDDQIGPMCEFLAQHRSAGWKPAGARGAEGPRGCKCSPINSI